MRWPEDGTLFPVLTLGELRRMPPADQAVLVSLARRLLEEDLPSAPGAWSKGARVRKRGNFPGDFHPAGTPGAVFGSVAVASDVRRTIRGRLGRDIAYFYFILFDDMSFPIIVTEDRLEVAT